MRPSPKPLLGKTKYEEARKWLPRCMTCAQGLALGRGEYLEHFRMSTSAQDERRSERIIAEPIWMLQQREGILE